MSEPRLKTLQEKIRKLPHQPGVYFFKDGNGEVLYVGKASSLRKRVASYVRPTGLAPRTESLMKRVVDMDYMVTRTEHEALIYEASLIQEKQPKYNVVFRDDKSYPWLRVTDKEKWPRVLVDRRRKKLKEKALWVGPFTDAGALKAAVKNLRQIFPLRSCNTLPESACLDFHLGLCCAPCIGNVSEDEYRSMVQDFVTLVSSGREGLIKELRDRMNRAAASLEFEEAARIRDTLTALGSRAVMPAGKYAVPSSVPALRLLKEDLKLSVYPRRLEAFDISNIQGAQTVASMVVFEDGKPLKADYRHYKIKDVEGIDDFESMRQVVRRRYQRLVREKKAMPDLIVVDGGKGQLSAAHGELLCLGLNKQALIGIAKREEEIFLPGRSAPVRLSKDSGSLQLVQRIRDEAHRFAVTHHRKLRAKQAVLSLLDQIPGVGETRKAQLLEHFGTPLAVARASEEELRQCEGISANRAAQIREYLDESWRY
ncbi:MAG: excinuclease ABC subunit UvrC [Candidatus Omnitrophica bacterium]|nr:excinuclease ABC subunit UvrC [Candidatus Omnitrophota bacterium]